MAKKPKIVKPDLTKMKNKLLGVMFGERRGNWAGHRVVRIEKVIANRKTGQIDRLIVRAFDGSGPAKYKGWCGRRFALEPGEYDPRFTTNGILVGRKVIPVDEFVAKRCPPKEKDALTSSERITLMDMKLPSLSPTQNWVKLAPELVTALASLLVTRPTLAKVCGLPGEPRWLLKCPDGARLDLASYDVAGGQSLQIIAYITPPPEKKTIGGVNMRLPEVTQSIRQLLKEHVAPVLDEVEPTPVEPPAKKTKKAKAAPPPPPGDPDEDYFA